LARIVRAEEVSFPGPYHPFPVCSKPGEKVVVGNGISLNVVGVPGNRVKIVLDAPDDIRFLRVEPGGSRAAGGRGDPAPWPGSRLLAARRGGLLVPSPQVPQQIQEGGFFVDGLFLRWAGRSGVRGER